MAEDAVMTDSETVESQDLPMQKIQSIDLLIKILCLLPPESVISLMCVSRRWRSIINDSLFLRSYSAAARLHRRGGRLRAFFQRTTNPTPMKPGKHCNTLPIPNSAVKKIEDIPKKFGYFINSSGGLILCSHEDRRNIYHVINPVTRKYVSLPPPANPYLPKSTGLMCEENTTKLAPVYTVVRAGLPLPLPKPGIIYIDTYTSRTGEWSGPTQLAATGGFSLLRRPPVVANGVFHWYSTVWSVAVYDPNDGDNHLQLIELPLFGSDNSYNHSYAITRSADDDLLWYGATGRDAMKFFVLPKGGGGDRYRRETCIDRKQWVLIYSEDMKISTQTIVLESIISRSNSEIVAVIRHIQEVFLYNLGMKSTEIVGYDGSYSHCHDNYLCPYVQSSFLSSYAL